MNNAFTADVPDCPDCGGAIYLALVDGKYGMACKNGHVLYPQITVIRSIIAPDAKITVEISQPPKG